MANCSCFCGLVGKNKKYKRKDKFQKTAKVHAPVEGPVESTSNVNELKSTSFVIPVSTEICEKPRKVLTQENSFRGEIKETEYEGEDEHDESMSLNRDSFDFDLQGPLPNINEGFDQSICKPMSRHYSFNKPEKDGEVFDVIKTGNVSDPGTVLKRSCSDLGRRKLKKISFEPQPSSSESFEEISEKVIGSPVSVSSHCSADKIMLKKHSSSHILPSRSRKLWWKLFLWSHRNAKGTTNTEPKPQPNPVKITTSKEGGYCSDTLESTPVKGGNKKGKNDLHDIPGVTGMWPQNQWVACPAESFTFSRVNEWVKELPARPTHFIDGDGQIEDDVNIPPSRPVKVLARTSSSLTTRTNVNTPEDVIHANNLIQSLNSSSTVAHIAGAGLKVSPIMSQFSNLRVVNLSSNSIVQITPGSLPKGLHVLNLSRNQIQTIDGLKELTRLQVLDLSYNRISRIGRGLSHCTRVKELYLTANKISYVEGLHRLLKLKVLDLSFNKITTTNALRQLVANYSSLISLNLLGNPIHSISDEQIRKTVCSLLRKLVYLNKQPIDPQKAKEQAVAEAVLGNNSWSTRRKTSRKINLGNTASSSRMQRSNSNVGQKMKHRLRSKAQSQSFKAKLHPLASSSH